MAEVSLIPERIESAILLIRGQKVMLDSNLASLYGVQVKVLNQAVKRNLARFPDDFMFVLTADEAESLRSQTVTSKMGRWIVPSISYCRGRNRRIGGRSLQLPIPLRNWFRRQRTDCLARRIGNPSSTGR